MASNIFESYNMTKQSYLTVGKIGSTYGVRGWLKIQTYLEVGTDLLEYKRWYLSSGKNDLNLIEVEDGRLHGKTLIVKFFNINSPEEARLLTGKTIYLDRSQLPQLQENEYYWSDLVGLTVIDQHQQVLGTVIYLLETGSNDVLVIKHANQKEYAIPFLLKDVILNIDLDKREIRVNWELI